MDTIQPWMVWTLAAVVVVGFLLGGQTGLGAYSGNGLGGQSYAGGALADLSRFGQSALAASVALLTRQLALGVAPRKSILGLVMVTLSVAVFSLQSGFLYPLFGAVFTMVTMGALLGVFRAKWLLLFLAATLLLGPALLELRNEVRAQTDSAYAQGAGPGLSFYDRVRQDLILAQMEDAVPSEWLRQPSAADILRTGLIPRPLDPDRPIITIQADLNVALGRSQLSSTTFTQPGNITYLSGYGALAFFYFTLGAAIALLIARFPRWLPVVLVATVVSSLVYVGASYPSSVAGALQNAEYSLVLIGILILANSAFSRGSSGE